MEEQVQDTQLKNGKEKRGCLVASCLTVLIVLVLFISGGICIGFWANNAPIKIVQKQLAYLRKGNVEAAYLLMSRNFRNTTSLQQFIYFISSNTLLSKNKGIDFTERKAENKGVYIGGALTAIDDSRTPINYKLIEEDDAWKILSMGISKIGKGEKSLSEEPVKEPVPFKTTVIEKIEVGTQYSIDGRIIDPSDKFPTETGEIKVSVYISGAKNGQLVSAVWFLGGQSIADPMINNVLKDGDIISSFYITPPNNGWPTGKYKVVISIDNGTLTKEASYFVGL